MNTINRYLEAATRENTRRSYGKAIKHYEEEAGRFLPATADQVAQYLADYAGKLSINTLRQRIAALAVWHKEQGFPDPTDAPIVKKVLKGIQAVHQSKEKQAKPLQLDEIGQIADFLSERIHIARQYGNHIEVLQRLRDRALVLLGFWRGFRSDELRNLEIPNIQIVEGEGLTCFLAKSKGDRNNQGRTYRVPALSRWCPVEATSEWLNVSGLTDGALFRSINQWGTITQAPLHPNSFIELLRRILLEAGIPNPEKYSAHSLRRGFASWASASGWDIKSLMQYVGWKDMQSAMRYLDDVDPFIKDRIEANLPKLPSLPVSPNNSALPTTVLVEESYLVEEKSLD